MCVAARFVALFLTACLLSAPAANANPTGAQVINGAATIQPSGNLLQITNSPNAIINWNTFSIAANEITRFVQQSSSSAVLNRVVTLNPSSIFGALQSNGRVFLINPSGIVFGPTAQIDVAGLVASTLNLSDLDFLAGRLRFSETPGAGAVVNQGAISGNGGGVYLVGSSVTNGGVITNPQGEVILAAGKSVELVNPGTPGLRVEINAPDNEALNLGQIIATSGRIGILAGLIRSSGNLNADRAVAGPAGEILLKAASIELQGPVSAIGGTITVESFNTTTLGVGAVVTTGNPLSIGQSSGSVCITSLLAQGCEGSASTPASIVVSTGTGGLVVNGTVIVLDASQPTVSTLLIVQGAGQPQPLVANFDALTRAARVFLEGTGQIVDSLAGTSQINDLPLGVGVPALGTSLAPPRARFVVEPKAR